MMLGGVSRQRLRLTFFVRRKVIEHFIHSLVQFLFILFRIVAE